MKICGTMASGRYPRPCIAEMGGKNACIVTAHADLERAATGIMRSAFGLTRAEVLGAVAAVRRGRRRRHAHRDARGRRSRAIRIGDPSLRENWMGPVTTANALRPTTRATRAAARERRPHPRGRRDAWPTASWRNGYFVAPTLAEAPAEHPLFREEMFLPIVMLCRVADREEAMRLANESPLGLTAGFYGSDGGRALLPRPHRGGRHLRQPPAGRHHRRLARLPALRRLEGLGLDRQGDRFVLLPAAIPARAVADVVD